MSNETKPKCTVCNDRGHYLIGSDVTTCEICHPPRPYRDVQSQGGVSMSEKMTGNLVRTLERTVAFLEDHHEEVLHSYHAEDNTDGPCGACEVIAEAKALLSDVDAAYQQLYGG